MKGVREAIGWYQDWANGSDAFLSWFYPDGTQVGLFGDINCDTLIAWLRAEPRNGHRFLDISAWRAETDQRPEAFSVTFALNEQYSVHFHGRTLLEALELAVLGVSRLPEDTQ